MLGSCAPCTRRCRDALRGDHMAQLRPANHNLDAARAMLRIAHPAKMSPVMIRSASLLALAFAWTLGSGVACAQDSASEMLTRLDRLEAAIRQLTGAMEQLQYRNQQLEQQVRRMQEVGE